MYYDVYDEITGDLTSLTASFSTYAGVLGFCYNVTSSNALKEQHVDGLKVSSKMLQSNYLFAYSNTYDQPGGYWGTINCAQTPGGSDAGQFAQFATKSNLYSKSANYTKGFQFVGPYAQQFLTKFPSKTNKNISGVGYVTRNVSLG